MSKITRKLVLSLLTVVLTVVALGTSTFAWFTVTNQASVQEFQANIAADSGIEIALPQFGEADPLNWGWKSYLDATDIATYISDYINSSFTFDHLSSENGVAFTNIDGNSTTTGFLNIPVYFRSDNISAINLNALTLRADDVPAWRTTVGFTNEHGTAISANGTFAVNAADAFRISLTDVTGSNGTSIFELEGTATNVVLGEIAGLDILDVANTNPTTSEPYTYGAIEYYYAANSAYPSDGDGDGSVLVNIPDTTLIPEYASPATPLVSPMTVLGLIADAGSVYGKANYGLLRIRVWFEGWDQNAYNSLLGETIFTSFSFEAA